MGNHVRVGFCLFNRKGGCQLIKGHTHTQTPAFKVPLVRLHGKSGKHLHQPTHYPTLRCHFSARVDSPCGREPAWMKRGRAIGVAWCCFPTIDRAATSTVLPPLSINHRLSINWGRLRWDLFVLFHWVASWGLRSMSLSAWLIWWVAIGLTSCCLRIRGLKWLR